MLGLSTVLGRTTVSAGLCLLLILLGAAGLSLWYSVSLAGRPFWLMVELEAGAVDVRWTITQPNGARNGFGNPGWHLKSLGGFTAPRVGPRYSAGGFLRVPLWLPAVVVAAPTVVAWRRLRRAAVSGVCSACGYDRRGLPNGVKCPECGRTAV
jgi:hypothetical protein